MVSVPCRAVDLSRSVTERHQVNLNRNQVHSCCHFRSMNRGAHSIDKGVLCLIQNSNDSEKAEEESGK